MAQSVFIDGAAGTTGLEIVDRLAGRGEFDILVLDDTERKTVERRRQALNDADFAILCLPDDAAKQAVELVDPNGATRIIDASSAHRVADGWTYGFPELTGREAIAEARRVSNPGCYPTGFLALIAPLVRAELLPCDWPYSVNAVSGYSGGGKALIERFESDAAIAFRTYGLALGHKHLPEMQYYAGLTNAPIFAPSVIPAFRGMIVEVPLSLQAMAASSATPKALMECLGTTYADSKIVAISDKTPDELLVRTDADPWDGMELHVFSSPDEKSVRLAARLDNLGKGASGAAIQNLNLMAGLEETTGLQL